jgi:hypothetical protein
MPITKLWVFKYDNTRICPVYRLTIHHRRYASTAVLVLFPITISSLLYILIVLLFIASLKSVYTNLFIPIRPSGDTFRLDETETRPMVTESRCSPWWLRWDTLTLMGLSWLPSPVSSRPAHAFDITAGYSAWRPCCCGLGRRTLIKYLGGVTC